MELKKNITRMTPYVDQKSGVLHCRQSVAKDPNSALKIQPGLLSMDLHGHSRYYNFLTITLLYTIKTRALFLGSGEFALVPVTTSFSVLTTTSTSPSQII